MPNHPGRALVTRSRSPGHRRLAHEVAAENRTNEVEQAPWMPSFGRPIERSLQYSGLVLHGGPATAKTHVSRILLNSDTRDRAMGALTGHARS